MILVTVDNIPGKRLQLLGIAKGAVVLAKHLGKDIASGFRNIVGGEMKAYTEMMAEARDIATTRLAEEASLMNADAVICIRYATAAISSGAAEVMAYGTAVRFLKDGEGE